MLTGLILFSALLHASWNAFVKNDDDRTLTMAWIMGLGGLLSLLALPFIAFPGARVWPYLVVTTILQNVYFGLVILSYRHGDLSQAYPIARGTAALAAAVGAAALGLDVLVAREWLGILISSLGIASLAFAAHDAGRRLRRSIGYPLMSGVFTAAYSIVDAMGARAFGNAFEYLIWMNICTAPFLPAYVIFTRSPAALKLDRGTLGPRLGAALVASLSYGIALWALSHGSIGRVAMLRETSVLFAAILGSAVLKEPFGARRVASALVILAGFALWP